MRSIVACSGLVAALLWGSPSRAGQPFAIEVVDAETGRGVPLIELRTVNEVRFVTDSAGLVAFDEPGLMGRSVYFHVRGHGYEFPPDGFGNRGRALAVVEGGQARIAVRRVNIAERLYRITGGGIYRDSLLLGRRPPTAQPALNALVLGSDSVLEATLGSKVRWFWGDTNRPSYPLGNYHTPTATSLPPGLGGLDPQVGVDLTYAVDAEGFAAPSARMPGDGPTWLDGLTVLAGPDGRERMFAAFAKVRPSMEPYERGLAEFDPATNRFAKVAPIPLNAPVRPFGHPFRHEAGGSDRAYFADPYPIARVAAGVGPLADLGQYEAFTCLLPGSTPDRPRIDREPDGSARFAWRRGAPMLDALAQDRLVRSGVLRPADRLFPLRDADSGRPVLAHRGSTYWNEYRGRWVMIAVEIGGSTSHLGEVWFAEADAPLGPWVYARKVAAHDRYSFYNPKQHPSFAKDGGRTIFFEGTYTTSFSGNDSPTPRYDYNQIMYKLDLGNPRLNLPVPIYRVGGRFDSRMPGHRVAFQALERPAPGTIPVGSFHVLPLDRADPPSTTTTLYEARGAAEPFYFVEPACLALFGGRPVGRVWKAGTNRTTPVD